ncbi:hypothetical protein [Nocardioides antri]|uniref:Transglycosylase SLT domain-containing protein n=1 Tax=Nocardioides antri TaxID=2607659 RepID=A0A5B1LUV0_9ACTN|nr:hypothetical protein [Nocardioides antri]KAA1424296.1 hypothetical protein F0U47_18850 [Nocardioides antri]
MTPRHRQQPARNGGAVRRAVLTSVLSALGLASVTVTAAAITLTNAEPQPTPAAGPTAETSTAADSSAALAAPVEVEDAPLGIPEIALVAADGSRLADIPMPALAAYQRAEAVLAQADKRCQLDWTLLAAVGHVVTGHGTTGGSELNDRGVMNPRHAGDPLKSDDGKRLPDSDAGRVDGDERFDRPVGPMQLSPATWAVVGVDSDGDGRRNAHDVDDAALAVAVLLCSGDGNLAHRAGRVDGVSRVNDDPTFIATVLAVDRSYRTQLVDSLDADPVVVAPSQPPTDLPTDLPTAVPTDARASMPSDAPTLPEPEDPSSQPTDPVTWTAMPTHSVSPTPTTPTTPPPSDTPSSDTPTDDPCTTESTDLATPTETPTDATTGPTEVPTVPTESASATEEPTDDPTDLPECPTDPAADEVD